MTLGVSYHCRRGKTWPGASIRWFVELARRGTQGIDELEILQQHGVAQDDVALSEVGVELRQVTGGGGLGIGDVESRAGSTASPRAWPSADRRRPSLVSPRCQAG